MGGSLIASEVRQIVNDVCSTFRGHHLRALKWLLPFLWAGCCFMFQSVMLHLTTMRYVERNQEASLLSKPLPDAGHDLFGHKDVKMSVLDAISGGAVCCFFFAVIICRDLRLWVKVFFVAGCIFVWKGVLDFMTVLPDSISFETCEKRIGQDGVDFFLKLAKLGGVEFGTTLIGMEWNGLNGKWPVRYCADMVVSGHTAVMFLFLLGCADLSRKLMLFMKAGWLQTTLAIALQVFVIACACTDVYMTVSRLFR
eukprot:TRINITY_DN7586_c0_g1_i3.p1 TRINITY_DN7586_c0_g1~~TRINITY_DN7586_c0_g1_i3.p1  ORF type:complete len:290 (+),score=22.56 TRINITY_DN7586_c0_g1_i3:114-872(+)